MGSPEARGQHPKKLRSGSGQQLDNFWRVLLDVPSGEITWASLGPDKSRRLKLRTGEVISPKEKTPTQPKTEKCGLAQKPSGEESAGEVTPSLCRDTACRAEEIKSPLA